MTGGGTTEGCVNVDIGRGECAAANKKVNITKITKEEKEKELMKWHSIRQQNKGKGEQVYMKKKF